MAPDSDAAKRKSLIDKRLNIARDICALIGLLTVVGWTLHAIGLRP